MTSVKMGWCEKKLFLPIISKRLQLAKPIDIIFKKCNYVSKYVILELFLLVINSVWLYFKSIIIVRELIHKYVFENVLRKRLHLISTYICCNEPVVLRTRNDKFTALTINQIRFQTNTV